VYRAAIHRGEEVALVAAITSSLDPDGLARLVDDATDVLVERFVGIPLDPLDDIVRHLLGRFDPFGIADDLSRLPIGPGMPMVEGVIDETVRAFAPEALAAMLLDPSSTPPNVVQAVLDDVLGVPRPMEDPPAAYYVGMLTDRGYLVGLPTSLPDVPSAVPRLPGE
jgi:hypothetical protein